MKSHVFSCLPLRCPYQPRIRSTFSFFPVKFLAFSFLGSFSACKCFGNDTEHSSAHMLRTELTSLTINFILGDRRLSMLT